MSNAALCTAALALGALLSLNASAQQAPAPYPNMAPIAQYQITNEGEEIALARSAAPAAIAANAEVLTLGVHGYVVAAQGTNGFVCIVERAWANDFANDGFWNPRLRAPICFNAVAARSVLPDYLQRTQWVLAGLSKSQMLDRTRAALAAGQLTPPEPGAMCYMMSKSGYLGDDVHGPWHPHLMFFAPRTAPEAWGANVTGGAVYASTDTVEPVTTFYVPVAQWSDGSPAMAMGEH